MLVKFDAFVALKYQTLTGHIYANTTPASSASGAAASSLFSLGLGMLQVPPRRLTRTFRHSWARSSQPTAGKARSTGSLA
jgi:hypothetical protein